MDSSIISFSRFNKNKQDDPVIEIANNSEGHKAIVSGNYIGNFKLLNNGYINEY